MKESIGGTQIFLIVVILVILFTGIMAFTINRSNAFAVKDELVSIIERAKGVDLTKELIAGVGDDTLEKIVEALENKSYRQLGDCPASSASTEVAAYQRNGAKSLGSNKSAFCIVKMHGKNPVGTPNSYYYQIIVFYTLDLPIFNEIFNFKAVGETKAIYS